MSGQDKEVHFRRLQADDYDRGIFELLAQLTPSPKPTRADFQAQLARMAASQQEHIQVVGVKEGRLVAAGTVVVCRQRDSSLLGQIQNIVTAKELRGLGYGLMLIECLKKEAAHCPRIALYCSQANAAFYAKVGFVREGRVIEKYIP